MKKTSMILASLVIASALLVVLPTLSHEVRASYFFVGGTGGGNHTTIQAAIDAAVDGDSVVVYAGTFTENIEIDKKISLIAVVADGVFIDGGGGDAIHVNSSFVNISGFTIINSDMGIRLYGASHCMIENNNVSNNDIGILLTPSSPMYSDNNTIVNNDVSGTRLGIDLVLSNNNSVYSNMVSDIQMTGIPITMGNSNLIFDNTLLNNSIAGIHLSSSENNSLMGNVMTEAGILLGADTVDEWATHSIDTSNTVNGKPVYYWRNVVGGTVPLGAGEVILANCTNVVVENQVITKSTVGITLGFSSNNTIANNTLSFESFVGIYLLYSDNNTLNHNSVTASEDSISIIESDDNLVFRNAVHSSGWASFHFYRAKSNRIYHNNILDPFWKVEDSQVMNQWDDGYPSGGNHWLDYAGVDDCSGPNQDVCPDPDGIGDMPLGMIPDDDRYPLMEPLLPYPPMAPFRPQNLTANPGDQKVTLAWNPPEFEGSSPVTNYRIYRGTSSGWKTLVAQTGNTLTYEDTGLMNGQKYYYEVGAVNGVGESRESEETSATPVSVPSAPRNLTAQAGDGEVALAWEVPLDSGGYPVQGYLIYRGTSPGAETFLVEVGNILSFPDNDDIVGGQTYYYQVAARNYVGEGLKSDEATATLTNHPPMCTIANPAPGETVSGAFNISGSSSDSDGEVEFVEIRIDEGTWLQITGTETWYYEWDTTGVSNGGHTVYGRAYDGMNYSDEVSLAVNVDNPDSLVGWLLILAVLIIIITVVSLYFFVVRRRKTEDKEESQEQELR